MDLRKTQLCTLFCFAKNSDRANLQRINIPKYEIINLIKYKNIEKYVQLNFIILRIYL